ncbi:unnamed protein product [Rotaria sordida]|uniref:Uncharacterized protein n=1 Tax=Rotaria sordida TaxID=392033 RepID=A0A815UHL1_9BILA|nr:unnamed protein product [Rotaria sordida]CAF1661407.1 unnamed protein product [Rotaria sordida]
MPQLQTFIFYISTEIKVCNLSHRKSYDDIQQTFKNIKYGPTGCIIDHSGTIPGRCHIYSLPFIFTRLEKISHQFSTIVLNTVTHLYVCDRIPMQHEFFMRMSQSFPFLKHFSIGNEMLQSSKHDEWKSDENPFCSIIEY